MNPVHGFLNNSPTMAEAKQRIQNLQHDIWILENYCNAQLVVPNLPSEILTAIFEDLVLSKYVRKEASWFNCPYKGLLSVSQVCKHWRNVALDSPHLWGYIYDHTSPKFTDLLLKRAQSAPLHLRASGLPTKGGVTIRQVLHWSSRLKEIDLDNCTGQYFHSIVKMKKSTLETLSLKALSHHPYTSNSIAKGRFDPVVEPGTVPPLRILSLTDYILDLDVPFFSYLQTLQLSSSSHASNASLSVTDVLHALGDMQHLELLELQFVLRGSEGLVPNDLKVLHTRLTRIVLVTDSPLGLALFIHLSCPNLRSAVAHARRVGEFEYLVSVASAFYTMIPSAHTWKTHLYASPWRSDCKAGMDIWPNPTLEGEAPFQISVDGPPGYQLILTLLSLHPASTPTVLHFGECGFGSDSDFVDLPAFLQSLGTIEELHISSIHDLIHLLSDTPLESTQSQPLPLFSLSSLKRISIVGDFQEEEEDLKKFGQLLAARSAANARIETLRIECSGTMDEADIEFLEPLVETLEFSYK